MNIKQIESKIRKEFRKLNHTKKEFSFDKSQAEKLIKNIIPRIKISDSKDSIKVLSYCEDEFVQLNLLDLFKGKINSLDTTFLPFIKVSIKEMKTLCEHYDIDWEFFSDEELTNMLKTFEKYHETNASITNAFLILDKIQKNKKN